MKSIMAGFMITLAAAINLMVGGALGAFLFAIGLITILSFQFDLFTGKAGLLAQKQIKTKSLIAIWFGNFVGCGACSFLFLISPLGETLSERAAAINQIRISNLWFENIILGIFCGILMYIAVKQYFIVPIITMLAVASFILLGANHCVADMAYLFLAADETFVSAAVAIVFTTIGNIIGCNLIPFSCELIGHKTNN